MISSLYGNGISYSPPGIEGFHPLYEDAPIISPLLEEHPVLFDIPSPLFKDTVLMDFEKRQITFLRYDTFAGLPIWQFHYSELDEYLLGMFRFHMASLWMNELKKYEDKDKKKKGNANLKFAMPIHYPAWARRVIGKSPPTLSIKGYQSINLSFIRSKVEKTDYTDPSAKRDNGPGFVFDWNNMFTIRGSIGRLINIEIKIGKDKDAQFDFKEEMKKQLRIEYKAEADSANQLEDEIIQEVIAGYTNFQMPGQGLAGYSGSHEGLFGVKIRSQFGPLSLTTVMSRENAETQIKELDLTGKAGGMTAITELDYAKNRFFFLDSIYLDYYLGKKETVPEVTALGLYKLDLLISENDNPIDYIYANYDGSTSLKRFKKLQQNKDYKLNHKEGWILFTNEQITSNDLIALSMLVGDNVIVKGNILNPEEDPEEDSLWVLKHRDAEGKDPNSSTYNLMWRNVYSLSGTAKPESFNIEILRSLDGKDHLKDANNKYYSEILGITNDKGSALIENEDVFDFTNKYLIFPPYQNSTASGEVLYSNRPFSNIDLGETGKIKNYNDAIYNDTTSIVQKPNFKIVTSGTLRQYKFNLGWGIMPNVTVRVGTKSDKGEELEEGRDYILQRDYGEIEFISDKARGKDHIVVEYQQESLFMFDVKRFMGAYGRLDFPNLGRESYLATTVMGQFTSGRDEIPRVGSEPFNRFLFDANLQLDFEPEWMTSLVNRIPLINTTSSSSATLDFEVAYSYLKPEKENGGEAYVDNFQSSERSYDLGERHYSWYKASPSPEWIFPKDSARYHPPAWQSYWYTMYGTKRTRRDEIWELDKDKNNTNRQEYLETMKLFCQPLPKGSELLRRVSSDSTLENLVVDPYAGIMTALPSSLRDRKNDKYFEFWLKIKDKKGKLFIDIGDVSEDISLDGCEPNGEFDYEKIGVVAGTYDSKYDLGIDTLPNNSEYYCFPNIHAKDPKYYWDFLGYDDPLLGDEFRYDPARDSFKLYDNNNQSTYAYANGTEHDLKLTSEDIDRSSDLTRNEDFYRIEIDLVNPDESEFIDHERITPRAKKNNWYHFRIPINTPDDSLVFQTVGKGARWNDIRFVRLLWSKFQGDAHKTSAGELEFMDMQFTGNQWVERIVSTIDSTTAKIIPSTLNTIDDKGFYHRPRYIDSLDNENILKKDYALRLEYENLQRGEVALVKKDIPIYHRVDLSAYDKIKFYVLNKEIHIFSDTTKTEEVTFSAGFPEKTNYPEFVFRFGRSDSCYYEYRYKFDINNYNKNWYIGHDLVIDLSKFTDLKNSYFKEFGDKIDTINISNRDRHGGIYTVYSKIRLLPSFSNVEWMALGIARDTAAVPGSVLDGDFWIHGMRVKGIKPVDGWAFRANLKTHWADFADFQAGFEYDDADFRKMSDEPHISRDANISAVLSSELQLGKIFLEEWGISIPVGTGIRASMSRPKYRPESDISLTRDDDKADRLGDMAKDFAQLIFNRDNTGEETDAEHFEKNSINKTWHTSFSKNAEGKNPVTKLTVDRITANYAYSKDSTTKLEGLIPKEISPTKFKRRNIGKDHIDVVSTRTHTASLIYDFTPRNPPKWTSWEIFAKVKSKNFPRHIKDYKLNLLPSKCGFDLVKNGTYTNRYTYRSINDLEKENAGGETIENLGMGHGFQLSYAPIVNLVETNYNLDINRNFDNSLTRWNKKSSGSFIEEQIMELDSVWGEHYHVMNAENSRRQNASINIDPQFFDWLTHTVDYRVDYNHIPKSLKNTSGYLQSNIKSDFNFTSNLRIRSLFTSLSDRTEKIKKLSKAFTKIEKAFDKIGLSSVSFRYDASMNLINDYLKIAYLNDYEIYGIEFFIYQLGKKDRSLRDIVTGNMNDWNGFGGVKSRFRDSTSYGYDEYKNDKRSTSQNISASTSLRLSKPLDININPISIDWRREYGVSWDKWAHDTTITFPDIRVGLSSNILERIPIIEKKLKKLGLRSTFNYNLKEHHFWKTMGDGSVTIDLTRKNAWDPLINIDGIFKKKPVNVDYTFRYSYDTTYSIQKGEKIENSGSSTKNIGHNWNVKYTIPGKKDRDFTLFNRWTVQIKGDLVLSLNATYDIEIKYLDLNATGNDDNIDMSDKEPRDYMFSVHPIITYDFTDNIDGLLEYVGLVKYNYLKEETRKSHNFAFTLTIYFK